MACLSTSATLRAASGRAAGVPPDAPGSNREAPCDGRNTVRRDRTGTGEAAAYGRRRGGTWADRSLAAAGAARPDGGDAGGDRRGCPAGGAERSGGDLLRLGRVL